jgi:hypothetical protein
MHPAEARRQHAAKHDATTAGSATMNNDLGLGRQRGSNDNGNDAEFAQPSPRDSSFSSSSSDSSIDGENLAEALAAGGDGSFVVEQPSRKLNRSTAVMFAVLVLGAAAVYFMYRKSGPRLAVAAAPKETVEAKKTISTFLSGGDSNIKLMEKMLKNTQEIVQQFLKYPSVRQVPLSDLQTNPFRHKNLAPSGNADHADNASDIAEKRRREEERLAIRKAADGLQLQSIMYSEARQACMINNTLYREAQMIDGFTIEKINPNSVIVKNGSYRFELSLKR